MILEFWQGAGDPVRGLAALLRWLALAAGLGAAGSTLFLVFMSEYLTADEARAARRWLTVFVFVTLVALAAAWPVQAIILSGTREGLARLPLYGDMARSAFGDIAFLKLGGLALMLFVRVRRAWGAGIGTAGVLLFAIALALEGTAGSHRLRQEMLTLSVIHAVAAAFWFGGLFPLRNVAMRREPLSAAEAVRAWSRPALVFASLAVGSGVALALGLFGRPALPPRSPAGWLLAAQALLVALMAMMALACRYRHTRLLMRGDVLAGAALRRSAGRQILLGLVVLYLSVELGAP